MCNVQELHNKVYQFDGFSFYHSLEQPNYWSEHSHAEIQIILPGSNARAWIEYQSSSGKQSSRQVISDRAFMVAQDRLHRLDWRETAELTLFYLHPRFFASAIGDSIESHHLEIRDRFLLVNDTLIREVGTIFRYLSNQGMAGEKLYIENLASLLAVHLLKNYLNYNLRVNYIKPRLSPKKLDLVLEYIEVNLDRKITLSKLASIAEVGKFYFCRLFKSSLGLTPYQYVIQQRVARAKRLLQYSNLSICEIALDCGFSSQSHLAKHFRSMVKVSPMNYRNSSK